MARIVDNGHGGMLGGRSAQEAAAPSMGPHQASMPSHAAGQKRAMHTRLVLRTQLSNPEYMPNSLATRFSSST